MANDLVVMENQLVAMAPNFEQALAGVMPADRLIRTVLISCERAPKLLQCSRESIFAAAYTFAVLGLEVDGATGQAYMIPFDDRKRGLIAQPCVGYKGYNTIAARNGLTITGDVVREGDVFDFEKGSSAYIKHKPALDGADRRIIAAWACASAAGRPPIIEVLSLREILDIKEKSPGAKYGGPQNPWNDPKIGFPAMAQKSVKRRLSRSTPLTAMTLAAAVDEAFEERGLSAHIGTDRQLVIDGARSPLPQRQSADETPSVEVLTAPRSSPEPSKDGEADEPGAKVDGRPGSSEIPVALKEFETTRLYWEKTIRMLALNDPAEIRATWAEEKKSRQDMEWPTVEGARLRDLTDKVRDRIAALEKPKP
jgi:recombination protein RecT